ncbi:diacylglycerol/lipid kinase family protein [Spirosoma sp. KUDC1026]|uniref:diacylglycerol/lipid kinase family protein n=1 Tax=Spirosoma sp. KUDC1026 TaxID=2745947 RepID=UPI00159BA5CF|nr:diacylglycerol kinase family protein [Spirosoma sp. KUDC1026]QKZ12471.1 diacylglycerol kinase family lipid kinase [Spirosoma sp. KUDC1026]
MTFLFAINPASGGKTKDDWITGIKNYFASLPHQVELFELDGQTDADQLPKKINEIKPDRVVAVGGDGTIKSVGEAILNTDLPLGILPAGSANGMARELGIPADLATSLDVLVNGDLKPIDLIEVNDGDYCLHLSDIGMNAQLVKNYQQNNLRGMSGYLRGVVKVLRKHRMLRVEINLGDECIQRAAFMIVLANARMYGTGAVINPDGDMSDGQFEVVVFRRLTIWEILKMFWHFKPFDPKKIEIFPATSISIGTHRKAYFQVDGEYRGQLTELKARIRPSALTVLVPKPATA